MEQRTTKDTREKVEVPAPAARVFWGDGLDWANLLPRPWAGVEWWNGYELGNWPDVVFALADYQDPTGALHGYCTYVEGEVTPRWYRSAESRDLAVSEEAIKFWASGQSEGPPRH